jgi:hypothetical protein
MITKLLVIQKIEEDGNVNIFQALSENFQWTFETDKTVKEVKKVEEYFPFIIFGDVNVLKRKPGRETKTLIEENAIIFHDDYGIPEGTVIGILPPENFIPDIIKFKDNPYIPVNLVGQVTTRPPGQIQILYNKNHHRCAIILHIHERQLFGIKCSFKKVSSEQFPENTESWGDELFDVSISRNLLNIGTIKTEDLKVFNETINILDLPEINTLLNEILEALKSNDKSKAQSKLGKFGKIISSSASTAGNISKVVESLSNGGAINEFVKQVVKYVAIDRF